MKYLLYNNLLIIVRYYLPKDIYIMPSMELAQRTVSPWSDHTEATKTPEPPCWRQVDPMIRGVWNMAQHIRSEQIVVSDHWLSDFVLKTIQSEERAVSGDFWPTNHSDFTQYFHADGFGSLAYGARAALQTLQREDATYVDWFAPPAAVRSVAMTPGVSLGMGISVGLGGAPSDKLSNIHHLSGSLFDPSVHAQLLQKLDGRPIDLFTARPKGGVSLFPQEPTAASFEYYLRLLNTVYRRMSPEGLLFTEFPGAGLRGNGYLWPLTVDLWAQELRDQGIDIDTGGHALVIKKAAHTGILPGLSDKAITTNLSLYGESSTLGCKGFVVTPALSKKHYQTVLADDRFTY